MYSTVGVGGNVYTFDAFTSNFVNGGIVYYAQIEGETSLILENGHLTFDSVSRSFTLNYSQNSDIREVFFVVEVYATTTNADMETIESALYSIDVFLTPITDFTFTPDAIGPLVFLINTSSHSLTFAPWTLSYVGAELSITYTARVDDQNVVSPESYASVTFDSSTRTFTVQTDS